MIEIGYRTCSTLREELTYFCTLSSAINGIAPLEVIDAQTTDPSPLGVLSIVICILEVVLKYTFYKIDLCLFVSRPTIRLCSLFKVRRYVIGCINHEVIKLNLSSIPKQKFFKS